MNKPKFVEIACSMGGIYVLDEQGDVWSYGTHSVGWYKLNMNRRQEKVYDEKQEECDKPQP